MNDQTTKNVAKEILAFLIGRRCHLNTERGLTLICGMQAGLRACGRGDLADPLGDWPCQTNEELAATINHWLGSDDVKATDLPAGEPFRG